MADVTAKTAAWLQSVVGRLPADIRAIYVEYGDSYTSSMEHLVCFNAFGFKSLAEGCFDPSNADHLGELGEFTWEPPDECSFRAEDHPDADWMTVLRAAAELPEVRAVAAERGIQLLVGEHDGDVDVIG